MMSTNNAAGCLLNRSLEGDTVFTEKPVPHDYPVSALETIEVRNKEALDAAAFYGARPVFLNFQDEGRDENQPAAVEIFAPADDEVSAFIGRIEALPKGETGPAE